MTNNPRQSRFTWHGLPAHEYPGHLAPSPRRRAFTLIELMVVITIVILLVGLLLVAVSKSMATGRRVRAQADLQSIAIALDAYKADFGDYPRALGGLADSTDGAWVLARALAAPGPETSTRNLTADGAGLPSNPTLDAPGFRIRPGGQGKIYGPYVDLEKFSLREGPVLASPNPTRYYLVDKVYSPDLQQPILYIPKNVRPIRPEDSYVALSTNAMYDATSINDYLTSATAWPDLGTGATKVVPLTQMQYMMGDKTPNGKIVAPDTPACTAPYILWMPGPDGMFGLTNSKGARDVNDNAFTTDDIANFSFDPAITVK